MERLEWEELTHAERELLKKGDDDMAIIKRNLDLAKKHRMKYEYYLDRADIIRNQLAKLKQRAEE